jgi:hypothetical protein
VSQPDFLIISWQGIVNDNYYQAIVDSKVSDPDQGMIYIQIMDKEFRTVDARMIAAPLKSGAIFISQAQGNQLSKPAL